MDDNPWGAPSPAPAAHDVPLPSTPASATPDVSRGSNEWGARETLVVNSVQRDEGALEEVEPGPTVQHEEEKVTEDVEEVVEPEVSPSPPSVLLPLEGVSSSSQNEGPPMDDFDDEPTFSSQVAAATPGVDGGDEFDDFGEAGGEDDFGDFGDFGEGEDDGFGAEPDAFTEDVPWVPVASTSGSSYPPLRLDLWSPARSNLAQQLAPFLAGAYPLASSSLSDEKERQVDGVGQVLVSEPLRNLLISLSSLPPLRPLDWRRSRVRREHLIVLGVPVNLDDSAESKPLASLVLPSQISISRTASPTPYGPTTPTSPFPPSRSATPSTDRNRFSAPPPLDRKRAEEVCAIREDDLILLSLSKLKALKEEVERLSIEAGEVLTHVLLVREKETGDGETYHRMIQQLVTSAAKMKTTSTGGSRWGRKTSGNNPVK